MDERFEGTYFDGRDGRAHAVVLRRVGSAHFIVEGDGLRRSGALRSIVPTPRLARIARTLEFADGARLQLADDAPIDAWFARQDRLQALVDRLERHAHAVAAAILVCVGALAFGAIWGVPWLADRIATHIPAGVEHALGEQVLASLDRFGMKASALERARQDELAARFGALVQGLDGAAGYRVEFRDAPGVGANAFALPGGTVVVTDQLVALFCDDREFDAVVAHEIGHQQNHHTLRQTLRGSMIAIVAALFAGDVSSAGAVVVAVPTFLLDSHYSREFEDEADHFALDLLVRHEETPYWFAAAMRSLQATHPEAGGMAYLASHPPTLQRIALADDAADAYAKQRPLSCPGGVCQGERRGELPCTAKADATTDDGDDGDDDPPQSCSGHEQ
ncbi:MAG TPA: M48 family metallopeptidase [Dokdonella sp.]